MKMKYSRRTSYVTPATRLTLTIAGAVLVGGIFLRLFFPDALVFVASPLWKLGEGLSELSTSFESTQILTRELSELKDKNETLVQENETFRARLADIGDEGAGEEQGILAGVLSRPPLSPYDVLIVGAGSEDGVSVGAYVFAKGVPIGTIEEVGARTSRVVLFSTPDRVSEGWVGEERTPLSLVGEGSGAFIAELSREVNVASGDIVYLPGPGAYPAGTVYAVESHPSSPRAKLIISPRINLFMVTWVRIAL